MIQSKSEKIILSQEIAKFHRSIIDCSEKNYIHEAINDKPKESQQISTKNLCLKKKSSSEYNVGNYLIQQTLGQGTFGKVKLGIYLPNNEKCAIKVLEKSRMSGKDDQIRVKREFDMLSKFNHPNVILVTEIFENISSYFSVMEFCEGGELFNYIVKKKRLSENESSFFYFQLINGLEYIHSLGIVHRDLKPENLLLTKEYLLKIIDFGLSNYYVKGQKDLLSTPCGSPCYTSPEMVAGKKYDGTKIDIWATGIILYAMLCGYLPFEDKDNDILFDKILECKIIYPDFLSSESKDLISKILVIDPEKRIDIPGIKNHSFFLKGKNFFEQIFSIKQIPTDGNKIENNYINNDKKVVDEQKEKIKETKEIAIPNDENKEKINEIIIKKDIIEVKNNNSLLENKENMCTENLNINESIIIEDIKYKKNIAENNANKNEKNVNAEDLKYRKNILKCINFRKIKKEKIEELNHKIKLHKDKKFQDINVKNFQNNDKIEKNEKIINKCNNNKDMEELIKANNVKKSIETSSPQRQNKKEKEGIQKDFITDKNKALDLIDKSRNMGTISSVSTSLEQNLKKLKNLGNITNFLVNNINYNVNISLGNTKRKDSPNNVKKDIFNKFKTCSNNILHENNKSYKNIHNLIDKENETGFESKYCETNKEKNRNDKKGNNQIRINKNSKYIKTLDNLEFQKQVLDLNRCKLLINNTHIKKNPKDFIPNKILDKNETFKSNNIISYGKKNDSSVKKGERGVQNFYSTSNSIEKDKHFHTNRIYYLNTYKNIVISKENMIKKQCKTKNIQKSKKYRKINMNINNANKLKDKTMNINKNYCTIETNSKDNIKPLSMKQFNLINKNVINNIKKTNKFQYNKLINPYSIEIEPNPKNIKKEKKAKRTIINSINHLATNEDLSNKKSNNKNKYSLNTLRKQPLINYNYDTISPNKTIKNGIHLKNISNNNQLFNSSSSHPKIIDSINGNISTNFKMFKPDLFSSIINKKKKKVLKRTYKPIRLELTQKLFKSIEVKKDNKDSFFKHDKSKFSFIESLTLKNKKKNAKIIGKNGKNNSNLISSKVLSNHIIDKFSNFNKKETKSNSKSKSKSKKSENKNSRKKILVIYSEREKIIEKNKINKMNKFNNISLKKCDGIKDSKNNSMKKYYIRDIAKISNINEYRERSLRMRKNKTENNLGNINHLIFQKCKSFHKHLKSFHSSRNNFLNYENKKVARLCGRNIKQRNKMKKVYLNTKIRDMKNISNEISFTVSKNICTKYNKALYKRHIISMKNIEHSNKIAHYK